MVFPNRIRNIIGLRAGCVSQIYANGAKNVSFEVTDESESGRNLLNFKKRSKILAQPMRFPANWQHLWIWGYRQQDHRQKGINEMLIIVHWFLSFTKENLLAVTNVWCKRRIRDRLRNPS
jgi:hypothetical protein